MLKDKIIFIFGVIGGYISFFLGGWTATTTTLLLFMVVDFLLGFILSAFLKKSNKTETGGLSSKVGFIGLLKKCLILVFLMIAYRLDLLLNVQYIKDGVCIAFITNELISIVENCGLIGFPIPKFILNAIDILKAKEEKK